jgi:hypothetical protein
MGHAAAHFYVLNSRLAVIIERVYYYRMINADYRSIIIRVREGRVAKGDFVGKGPICRIIHELP